MRKFVVGDVYIYIRTVYGNVQMYGKEGREGGKEREGGKGARIFVAGEEEDILRGGK